jgi:hypothetical protein
VIQLQCHRRNILNKLPTPIHVVNNHDTRTSTPPPMIYEWRHITHTLHASIRYHHRPICKAACKVPWCF